MTEYDRRGININSGCSPKEVKKNADGTLEMTYSTPDGEATGTFDQILMATGRSPNTSGIGLEDVGIKTNKQGCVCPALAAPLLAMCACPLHSARARATLTLCCICCWPVGATASTGRSREGVHPHCPWFVNGGGIPSRSLAVASSW